MELFEKTLSRQDHFSGRVFDVHVDSILFPDGQTAQREVVEHSGGVLIAPLTDSGELIFVRQFRYPYGKVLLELPAGKLEPGEEPLRAGLRELHEETGATAGRTESLGLFYPTPGYCSEVIHMFAALNLTEGTPQPDEDEYLEIVHIPLKKAVQMVLANEIADGKTQAAILKLSLLHDKSAKIREQF
ncbi:MAG: NUDIX hydrolase [Oscillospiraceae bacterium]|jgi:ADP-ribose pyrophosphatase|nr:NUDIX hydrolase [Oscillospiraceae bacterium]